MKNGNSPSNHGAYTRIGASFNRSEVRYRLMVLYRLLDSYFGDLHWWPAETREEVMIGAVLVQNVSWANTIKAIDHLRGAQLLRFQAIDQTPSEFWRVWVGYTGIPAMTLYVSGLWNICRKIPVSTTNTTRSWTRLAIQSVQPVIQNVRSAQFNPTVFPGAMGDCLL